MSSCTLKTSLRVYTVFSDALILVMLLLDR